MIFWSICYCAKILALFFGQENDITDKDCSPDEHSKSSNTESIWIEGLVPGIDFCNHSKSSKFKSWTTIWQSILIDSIHMFVLRQETLAVIFARNYINYNKSNYIFVSLASLFPCSKLVWLFTRCKGIGNMGNWFCGKCYWNSCFDVPHAW